jgi:DNA-binding XRE family transcriptional regulator
MKKKPSVAWSAVKQALLKNKRFATEVKALEPELEMVRQIIRARIDQNLSQSELARRVGTRQSNISRLESGDYNPSLQFLKKIAGGLGKQLHICLK